MHRRPTIMRPKNTSTYNFGTGQQSTQHEHHAAIARSHLFEKCASTATPEGSYLLESYQCLGAWSTLVLYSRKTVTPLAALTLKAGTGSSNESCYRMLTARPSLNEPVPFFQGMLNLPDQPFSFVLSNLSDKSYIHFSIGHLPDPKVVGD